MGVGIWGIGDSDSAPGVENGNAALGNDESDLGNEESVLGNEESDLGIDASDLGNEDTTVEKLGAPGKLGTPKLRTPKLENMDIEFNNDMMMKQSHVNGTILTS